MSEYRTSEEKDMHEVWGAEEVDIILDILSPKGDMKLSSEVKSALFKAFLRDENVIKELREIKAMGGFSSSDDKAAFIIKHCGDMKTPIFDEVERKSPVHKFKSENFKSEEKTWWGKWGNFISLISLIGLFVFSCGLIRADVRNSNQKEAQCSSLKEGDECPESCVKRARSHTISYEYSYPCSCYVNLPTAFAPLHCVNKK